MEKQESRMVAETTVQYLGGIGKLRAMTGANGFTYDEEGTLKFSFKGCRKANQVAFKVEWNDLYSIRFMKYNNRTCEIKEVKKIEGLYFDQLRHIFERETGLFLSL